VIPRQAWHRIENHGRRPVVIIEIQHGNYLGEDDIVRRQDDYGRINRK
jgi:mannose-6-phosphate isomerase-like protein (cupin superfamily)